MQLIENLMGNWNIAWKEKEMKEYMSVLHQVDLAILKTLWQTNVKWYCASVWWHDKDWMVDVILKSDSVDAWHYHLAKPERINEKDGKFGGTISNSGW